MSVCVQAYLNEGVPQLSERTHSQRFPNPSGLWRSRLASEAEATLSRGQLDSHSLIEGHLELSHGSVSYEFRNVLAEGTP